MRRMINRTKLLLAGLATLLLAVTLLAGCDFLDKEPLAQLTTENFFESERDAVAATNATYNMLRNFNVHVFAWLGMTDIVSDEATKGSTPTDASFLLAFEDLEWTPTNTAFGGVWEGYYQGIYRANVAIQNIPNVDMDENLRARLVAENKFLRAYFYFFLVRAFGGVPLITEPLQPGEFEQPRASAEEVYSLIEQDLTEAIEALPPTYPSSELGRATRGAAQGLLAKVHLFQEEYDSALQQAEAVINSGQYALESDYSSIFTVNGEFSSGSIFEIQNIELEEGGGSSQYAQVQGVRGFPNLGWGFNQPSDHLETLYEPGDRRQQATILYPWEIVEEGSDVVVHINTNIPNQQYNEKAQVPLSTTNSGESTVNIRRLRYADVLLIAAEAAAQTGNTAQAQNYLNQVRQRARGDQEATLGIIPERLNEQLAMQNLGLDPNTSRVFVRYVSDGGPAAQAGVQSVETACIGSCDPADEPDEPIPALFNTIDIIQAVDGAEVTTPEEYLSAIRSKRSGQTVSVEVLRVTQQASGEEVSTSTETLLFDITAVPFLPDVTATGQALLEAIWGERGTELAMEQHRWFDIVRQGRAAEVMAEVGKTFQEFQRIYPIPQSEVDLAGLEQNPGY